MIVLEMIGPIKDEALPIMLKRLKNKYSLPRGVTSDIMVKEYEYQGHTKKP